jgi:hypothetical protein
MNEVVDHSKSLPQRTKTRQFILNSALGGLAGAAILWLFFPIFYREVSNRTTVFWSTWDCYCVVTTGTATRTTYLRIGWDEKDSDWIKQATKVDKIPDDFCRHLLMREDYIVEGPVHFQVGSLSVPCKPGPMLVLISVWLTLSAALAMCMMKRKSLSRADDVAARPENGAS